MNFIRTLVLTDVGFFFFIYIKKMSDSQHKENEDYVGALNPIDKNTYKKYRKIASVSWKKNYMDLLLPGILLAVTLVWRDLLNLSVKNVLTYFGVQETAVVLSTASTAIILTIIAFWVSGIKKDIDEEAVDLGIISH